MPELDLLDFLAADHQLLLKAVPVPAVAEVSQHLSVERDLLYPVIGHQVAYGEGMVEDLRAAERQLEERLREFERQATAEHAERLRAAIVEHVSVQEELFPRLRGLIPGSVLVVQTESIALSVGGSPTHAHPLLAEGGLLGQLVEDVTSAADHTLDRLHSTKDAESD